MKENWTLLFLERTFDNKLNFFFSIRLFKYSREWSTPAPISSIPSCIVTLLSFLDYCCFPFSAISRIYFIHFLLGLPLCIFLHRHSRYFTLLYHVTESIWLLLLFSVIVSVFYSIPFGSPSSPFEAFHFRCVYFTFVHFCRIQFHVYPSQYCFV